MRVTDDAKLTATSYSDPESMNSPGMRVCVCSLAHSF